MHVSLAVGRVCAFCKGVPFSHFVTLFCNTLRTGEMGLQSRLFIEVKNEIPLMRKSALAVVAFLCLDLVLSTQVANGAQGEQATQTQKAGPPFANADVILHGSSGFG